MKELEVNTSRSSSCSIIIGNTVLEDILQFIDTPKWTSIHIVYDPIVETLAQSIAKQLNTNNLIPVKDPEDNKSFKGLESVCQKLQRQKADRYSLVVNVGGGALCDLGGCSASVYMRGIAFVQIPTTLLSQVDASIGGKTGINAFGVKNLIGTFSQPKLVIIDPQTLRNLPANHIGSGFGEILKHGLILDSTYWQKLADLDSQQIMNDPVLLESIIYDSNQIKHKIVVTDELEDDDRKKLNFGHTVGHAIESLSHDTDHPYLHGEAVAIGMVVEAELSDLDDTDKVHIREVLQRYNLPTTVPSAYSPREILKKMKADKKNKAGNIRLTLLDAIGTSIINQSRSEDEILKALERSG